MATTQIGFANISGLAADTKPTTGIGAGSTFYETDTKKSFIYDGTAWNETGGSGALFQFNYQWKLAVDASPPTHYMSRDNAVTASITKLYVNKVDATGHDMSLFLSEITAGDDLTLHDHNDADIYIVFTASAAATLTGNAFTIPVTFVKQNGHDFTDNESVNIHWVSESSGGASEKGGIAHSISTDYVVGDIVSVLKETYQCITAHTAKAFNAANWLQIWNSEQKQGAPIAPVDVGAAYDQVGVQAILDYAKEIADKLELAKVFNQIPTISGRLIPGATGFDFESDAGEGFIVEQDGNVQVLTGNGTTAVSVTGLNDASDVTIKLTGANTYFKFKDNKWVSISLISVGNITTLRDSFKNLKLMTSFDNSAANLSKVTNFYGAWSFCMGLTSFDTSGLTSGTSFGYAWNSCLGLTSFDASGLTSCINSSYAWNNCSGLTSFDTSGLTSSTNISGAWNSCSKLTSFDTSGLTSGTSFGSAWNNCLGLTSFDASGMTSGTNFDYTWYRCSKIVCFKTLNINNLISGGSAFNGCTALVQPPANGTPVRDGDNATAGTWTNPNPCP